MHIVHDNRFVSARKSPWAVPFGSDTPLKSELGYQCLIFQEVDHYGQFQNGRRKIYDFSGNVLPNMVFLNFTSQAQFWYLILHFIARLSIYKCCNVIFTTESKMATRKWCRNEQNFTFFANCLLAQALMVYDNLHERYHFIERHVPINKNQEINAWCVEY